MKNLSFIRGVVAGLGLVLIFGCGLYISDRSFWVDESYHNRDISIDENGTIHTPIGVLPIAESLSPEAQDAMKVMLVSKGNAPMGGCDISGDLSDPVVLLGMRKCYLEARNLPEEISRLHELYPDAIVNGAVINGIDVDIVTPSGGISERNRERICLGHYAVGSHTTTLQRSMT